MKKLILAVFMGLIASGGVKEVEAMMCCSGSTTGTGITGGSRGPMSGGTGSMTGGEMVGNRSAMAGQDRAMGPCGPGVRADSEATNDPSGSNPHEMANEAQSPLGQETRLMTPGRCDIFTKSLTVTRDVVHIGHEGDDNGNFL